MSDYAKDTTVSADRSKTELERLMRKYGATAFVHGWDGKNFSAVFSFEMDNRQIRFRLPLPMPDDRAFQRTPGNKQQRNPAAATAAYEKAVRARWRALVLAVKAKLVSIDDGIETFEEAFMSHIVLPNGSTVADWLTPQIDEAYRSQRMPDILPGIGQRALSDNAPHGKP